MALALRALVLLAWFCMALAGDETHALSLLQTRAEVQTRADRIRFDASVQAIQCVGAPCDSKGECAQGGVSWLRRIRRSAQIMFSHEADHEHDSWARRVGRAARVVNGVRCCADGLFDLLVQTTNFLESRNITYFVWAGTLLGAVRDKDIIPYTADIDIAMHIDGIEQLVSSTGLFATYGPDDVAGYGVVRGCEEKPVGTAGTRVRGFDWRDSSLPYIDIYNIDAWLDIRPFRGFLHGDEVVEIRGRKFRAPSSAEHILDSLYGNWHEYVRHAHG